jgi:DNA-directed RNA polymerase subunit M/transcription elongation factor TFIIS
MSAAERTVGAMMNQVQITTEHDVLSEPCPRCESMSVRVVTYTAWVELDHDATTADAAAGALPVDEPLFDCRECGFEWGELVRDLMR